ncbi:DUF1775 domain-containing protein [Micromonospora thermarum]|uniref:DUF1775 domain-containing protein n=1 Tax=Micromonospora thermarum TaxID=2720024 RepID=A0ABX0ZD46_9ACTN|nr:DUF1775 domain-containing protein [Micromonospora thermarum]NJP33893.1 DUF1775 domain-containing protein [Micromonospora thermarum]
MARTREGRGRRAGAVTALVAGALLAWPGTAYAADVTVQPTRARQGEAVKLEFVVPEERAGTRTERIEVRLPADAPIAEVYPMSVTGWAPRIATRELDRPVAGIHSSRVTMVTSAVTWFRMPGSAAGPARLTLAVGPLPQVERLSFEVLQTYADGTVVRWSGPAGEKAAPALTLLPPAPGAAGGGHGHGAAPGTPGAGNPAGTADASEPDGGNTNGLLAAGLLAGLGGGVVGGWLLSRWRRREPSGERNDLRAVLDGDPPGDEVRPAERTTATDEAARTDTAEEAERTDTVARKGAVAAPTR